MKDHRPGAHNHVDGAPKPSLDYVREMGDDDPAGPEERRHADAWHAELDREHMDEGWQPVFEDGEPTEALRSSLRAYVDAELGDEIWRHARLIEPHPAQPDREREYVQRQTGRVEAPCLACGSDEVVILQPQTFIVRFTYKRKGHPRAALDSVLKGIHPSVFETEVLDA